MKNFAIVVLLLATAVFSFGQSPRPAISASGASSDVYVGFLATSPDYGTTRNGSQFFALQIYGGELAYTRNLNKRLGITAQAAFSGGTSFNVKEFSGTVGPRFNFMTGRIRPYGTVQIGFAALNSDGMYARDHHLPLPRGTNTTESGFSYRMGGGVDFQVTDHLYWRVIEYDIQPQPWANNTPIYQNIGGGIGYRF